MKFKKTKLVILLSVLNANLAFSSGIPTVDVAAIANGVQMLLEAQNQLKELQDQVNTAKNQLNEFKNEALEQKRRLEGFMDYQSMFDSSVAYVKNAGKEWADLASNWDDAKYQKMKKEYDIPDDLSDGMNHYFNEKGKMLDAYAGAIESAEEESKKLDKLLKEFKDAETPARREELSNTINMQRARVEAAIKKAQLEKEKFETKEKIEKESLEIKHIKSQLEYKEFNW